MRPRTSLGRHWTVFVLVGSVAQRGGTLISTIYLVHFLGPQDFASIVPLLPIAPLITAAALLGQDQAVLRFLLQNDRVRLTERSSVAVAGLVAGAGAVMSLALAGVVGALFPVSFLAAAMSGLGATALAATQAARLSQLRAIRSGPWYAATFACYGLFGLTARVAAIHLGVASDLSWALGDLAGGLTAAGVAYVATRLLAGEPASYQLRQGVRYGLPLLPHSLAQQVLGNADRWIFAGRVPPTQLAIYVTAYQLASGVNIILTEFNRSRQHQYVGVSIAAGHAYETRERGWLLTIVAALTLPVALASALVVPEHFRDAFLIALGICVSFVSLAFYIPLANLVGLTVGRTSSLARASISGAVANVLLNGALVHTLNVWAGIVANFVGFFLMYAMLARGLRKSAVVA